MGDFVCRFFSGQWIVGDCLLMIQDGGTSAEEILPAKSPRKSYGRSHS